MSKYLLLVLLVIGINSQLSYFCDVANCQACTHENFCGRCMPNYILQINMNTSIPYCANVYCDVKHCSQCYENDICSKCQDGFYLTASGTCTAKPSEFDQCSDNCLVCGEGNQCQRCLYGHVLRNDGRCVSRVIMPTNCQAGFFTSMCQVCKEGYGVGIAYTCVQVPNFGCNVDGCSSCSYDNYCYECNHGYGLDDGKCLPLSCNERGCIQCKDATSCERCVEGMQLNNGKCSQVVHGCSVERCLYCASPQNCTVCQKGYKAKRIFSQGRQAGSTCERITQGEGDKSHLIRNCELYDKIPAGTDSFLVIGCVDCEDSFINVGGLCLANITQQYYSCNVLNCVYCIEDDYCGKCGDGYYVRTYTGGQCWKMYSPLPHCKLTTLYLPICLICDDGYVLNQTNQCTRMEINKCQIQGCSSCYLTNVCEECRFGFSIQDGKCNPLCSINHCYACANENQCQTCSKGFLLNEAKTQCNDGQQQNLDCSSLYADCQLCNQVECLQCTDGYALSNIDGKCCEAPQQNMMGCIQYLNSCSAECVQCQIGFIWMEGHCHAWPCHIQNCRYCFRSEQCEVCDKGYNLHENKCQKYTPNCDVDFCVECSSEGVCERCLEGYIQYNGECVCKIQNCLECQGDSFCKECAFPTQPGQKNCLMSYIPFTLCQIPNCANCNSPNLCARCSEGYSLTSDGTCTRNVCDRANNCLLCSVNQNMCYLCKEGYTNQQVLGKQCVKINSDYSCEVDGCSLCASSSTCEVCSERFELTPDKKCQPLQCIENCLLCYEPNTCTACRSFYYLTEDNECVAESSLANNCTEIDHCMRCKIVDNSNAFWDFIQAILDLLDRLPFFAAPDVADDSLACVECQLGFMPTSDGQSCTPQTCNIPNCRVCYQDINNPICYICEQGYYANSFHQCIKIEPNLPTPSCDVYNCLYCNEENHCSYCLSEWVLIDGLCQTSQFCQEHCERCTHPTECVQCQSGYQSFQGKCKPSCNVQYCQSCADPTSCGQCNDTFILSDNRDQCRCPQTYNLVNDQCVCPEAHTESAGRCYLCNIDDCARCFATNQCDQCANTFQLTEDNTCECPPTFQLRQDICQCPEDQLVYEGRCVNCVVENCNSCNETDVCFECVDSFILSQDGCECPDSTFQIVDGRCSCPSGTKQHNQTCLECDVESCQECSEPNECSQCVETYQLSETNNCSCPTSYTQSEGKCYQCKIDNCVVCNASNICSECEDDLVPVDGECECPEGQTFSSTGDCVECDVNNCNRCDKTNVCAECITNNTLLEGQCIGCGLEKCVGCDSFQFCGECEEGYTISSQGECVRCNVLNCVLCSTDDNCVTCNDGLELNADGTSCVECGVWGCQICSDDNVCSQCSHGLSLFLQDGDEYCDACTEPCLTCNVDGSCQTCLYPYSLEPSSQGICFTCQIQNCKRCSTNNPQQCQDCNRNYILVDGVCNLKCKSNKCLACTEDECLECRRGFAPVGSKCKRCQNAPKCVQCSSTDLGTCLECGDGYYLEDGLCNRCQQKNCKVCTSEQCLEFKESTKQKPFKNKKGKIVPVVCDPGCQECSLRKPNKCVTCHDGFYLRKNKCHPCDDNCKKCTNNQCLQCYENAFLSNGACNECNPSSNCLTCKEDNLSECVVCPYQYVKNADNVCVKDCPKNCLYCQNSDVCLLCKEGYAANSNGQCLPCLSNCRECSGLEQGLCLSCGYGFFLSEENVCQVCDEFCLTCSEEGCDECFPGYSLTQQFKCAKNCEYPCASCAETDPSKCVSCIGGFQYNENTFSCEPVVGGQCEDGQCELCPLGYQLSGNECVQCEGGCGRCEANTTSVCTGCFDGQYLTSDGECQKCNEQCLTCSSGSGCLTCASGYTVEESPVASAVQCVKCQFPCQQCRGDSSKCSSCVNGYQLKGWACLSVINFGFSVVINTDKATFYQNYGAFLRQIAESQASTDIDLIIMSSIDEGSVVVGANVTTNNTQQSSLSSQEDKLAALLTSGDQIAGMSIISSEVDTNNFDLPSQISQPSSVNLGLILGITIPAVIILIGVIVYCLVFRKKKYQEEDEDFTLEREMESVKKPQFNISKEQSLKEDIYLRTQLSTRMSKKASLPVIEFVQERNKPIKRNQSFLQKSQQEKYHGNEEPSQIKDQVVSDADD